MDACSRCPHSNDCQKVGACLDALNAPLIASGQFPQRMTPKQASTCMVAMREGKTLRRITNGGKKNGPAIVSLTKLKKHCALYPEWGAEVKRLAKVNAKAADALKGLARRSQTHCIHGHLLEDKRRYKDGRRHCVVCAAARAQLGGVITRDQLKRVKAAIGAGTPISHFTGGGRPGYIVKHRTFLRYRNENPEFNHLVLVATKENNSKGRTQRFRLKRMALGGRAEQANDFHKIAAMVPGSLPQDVRDEIVQSIFLAILEQRLRFDDVRARIGEFLTAHKRMFPTNFAKFGDARLVSLDEVMFEDGSTTRGDTVSRGLWD